MTALALLRGLRQGFGGIGVGEALAEGAGDDERAARLLHGLLGQMHRAQPHGLRVALVVGARVL